MEWYMYLGIVGTGLVAGFINTMAGSGSLLTLPLLMFLGMPANLANGTNRIAILLQNIVGTGSFIQQKKLDIKTAVWLGIPAIIGSLAGSKMAVSLSDQTMETVIGALLFIMFFIILIKPGQWLKKDSEMTQFSHKIKIHHLFIFFLIGIYGGFIQAGVGFFLLAGLVIGVGADLVRANALKLFIILLYTPFALAIFIMNDNVDFKIGVILAAGNMIGAFIGSRVAVKRGPAFIRIILLMAIALSALKLSGAFELFQSLMK